MIGTPQGGYPGQQQGGYPQGSYPTQPSGYPGQQPGQGGYPGQQPPPAQVAAPGQHSFAPQGQTGYGQVLPQAHLHNIRGPES